MMITLPLVTAPAQAAVGRDLGGKLNSCVIQNRSTGTGEYVEVWFSDCAPDPTDTGYQFYFRILPGTALIIDPSDTSFEESTRKISVQRLYLRGNVTDAVDTDVFWTTKYSPLQGVYGNEHQVVV